MNQQFSGKPLKKEDIQKEKNMIKQIEDIPQCSPFKLPVPYKKHIQLLNYPDIVKRPMDFSTLKKKLGKDCYQTYEAVFEEI